MTTVALSLGSNLGDRLQSLRKAVSILGSAGLALLASSDVFETPPWGVEDQPRFLNACILVETELSPEELLGLLKHMETTLGRTPEKRWGPRVIDMDILFYDGIVLRSPTLTVPHRELSGRAFVLLPLAQAAPEWKHPETGLTAGEMARALPPGETEGILRICEL
jgi:2-amino-4-hydroxy-6-hydroxymethyldihydropteridine diphosphokinase